MRQTADILTQRRERVESTWTRINGLHIYARIAARPEHVERTAIVLIHGLFASSRYMIPTVEQLAPQYRVYAPDLPGFGRSGKPHRVLSMPGLADIVAAWMQVNGLSQAALVGSSLGCQVVVDLALRYPERITRAVLAGPAIDPRRRTMVQQAMRLLLNSSREPRSYRHASLRDYRDVGVRRAVHTFRYAQQSRIEEKLPHVQIPTLVVRGAGDPVAPQDWTEEVTRLLPRGRLVVIPGAAHAVNYTAAGAFARAVHEFLAEVDPL